MEGAKDLPVARGRTVARSRVWTCVRWVRHREIIISDRLGECVEIRDLLRVVISRSLIQQTTPSSLSNRDDDRTRVDSRRKIARYIYIYV